jgi:hypothetical protein
MPLRENLLRKWIKCTHRRRVYGYHHASHYSSCHPSAWRRRLVRPWTLVLSKGLQKVTAHSSDIGAMLSAAAGDQEQSMNNIIWLVGAVVIVLFILGYFGLR